MKGSSPIRAVDAECREDLPDLVRGLTHNSKYIEARFLYDDFGSALFDRITKLPEYYLTRVESEVLATNSEKIADAATTDGTLRIVELGAGDARKVTLILDALIQRDQAVTYVPVDVSSSALASIYREVSARFSSVRVRPFSGDFDAGLSFAANQDSAKTLFLFLGSSIGNFGPESARRLLRGIRAVMGPDDLGLIGYDLTKDPAILMPAYADSSGVTRAFNLNLLERMRRELAAQVDISGFQHHAFYDPRSESMESFLISLKSQTIDLPDQNLSIRLHQHEAIHTESSYKYRPDTIAKTLASCALSPVEMFFDERRWFTDALVRPID